jgi:hypothetical protein
MQINQSAILSPFLAVFKLTKLKKKKWLVSEMRGGEKRKRDRSKV